MLSSFFNSFYNIGWYQSQVIPNLMASAHNSGNLPSNDICKREAPTRAEFIDFQRETQQALLDIQITLARVTMDPDMNHKNNRLATMMGLVFNLFVIVFICLQISSQPIRRILAMMKTLFKAYSKILLQTIIRIMIIRNLEIFA